MSRAIYELHSTSDYLHTVAAACTDEILYCIIYLTSWHYSIFDYKLRTKFKQLRLKILKKLKTASLNSKFPVSYKKKCNWVLKMSSRWPSLGGSNVKAESLS